MESQPECLQEKNNVFRELHTPNRHLTRLKITACTYTDTVHVHVHAHPLPMIWLSIHIIEGYGLNAASIFSWALGLTTRFVHTQCYHDSPSLGRIDACWLARPLSILGVCFRQVQSLVSVGGEVRRWATEEADPNTPTRGPLGLEIIAMLPSLPDSSSSCMGS